VRGNLLFAQTSTVTHQSETIQKNVILVQ